MTTKGISNDGKYFMDEKNVRKYIRIAEGYDGKEIIEKLKKYLKPGVNVLELGMGPGKDMDFLSDRYEATGSDYSRVFLDLYEKEHPNADLLLLDATDITTSRKFDCIYSNKVLHHLSKKDLGNSIKKQYTLLNNSGILCHTFWSGDKEELMQGLRFVYYTPEMIEKLFKDNFEILEISEYDEMESGDSVLVIARKKYGLEGNSG